MCYNFQFHIERKDQALLIVDEHDKLNFQVKMLKINFPSAFVFQLEL